MSSMDFEDNLRINKNSLSKEGKNMKNESAVLLISSCDAYEDLWGPFFTFLFRYWPDCPFPFHLITNHLSHPDPRVNTITVGDDKGWATNTRNALETLNSSYIIYFQEDFFLDTRVNNNRILNLLDYAIERNAGYLRLYPSPGPDIVCADNPIVGEIVKGSKYRTGLQAAIWNREVLLSLLKDGEDGWLMEVAGSIRSNNLDMPFLSMTRNPISNEIDDPPLSYFCTAVLKGRWMRAAVDFCEKEGVPIDLTRRPVDTLWIEFFRKLRQWRHKLAVYLGLR